METISNIATAARNSVFGDATPEKRTAAPSTTTTPTLDTTTTASTTEPPNGSPPGPGTEDKPYDPGNAATAEPISPTSPTTDRDLTKPKKSGTAAPGSHSALFGLGPAAASTSTTTSPTSPSAPGGGASADAETGAVSGTIDQAAAQLKTQAVTEQKAGGATAAEEEEETGGYVGLKKAAEEEEEKKRRSADVGGVPIGAGVGAGTGTGVGAGVVGDEEREARSRSKKASVADSLGRDISPGEMPDGTHRKSIAEGMPTSTTSTPKKVLGRSRTDISSGGAAGGEGKSGGFRDRLKEKFRSKK